MHAETQSPAPTMRIYAATLESVLGELSTAHEELLALIAAHRRALARADAAGIQECLTQQGVIAARMSKLESARAQVTTQLTGGRDARIGDLVALLPAPYSDRIAVSAGRLRSLAAQIKRENNIVRMATGALIGHIEGLMQQIARAMSRAGTYGRGGRIETHEPLPCGVDLVR